MLSYRPLWLDDDMDVRGVSRISAEEFEAVWSAIGRVQSRSGSPPGVRWVDRKCNGTRTLDKVKSYGS
jgi:hypothetical protein